MQKNPTQDRFDELGVPHPGPGRAGEVNESGCGAGASGQGQDGTAAYREECGRRGKMAIKTKAEEPARQDAINY